MIAAAVTLTLFGFILTLVVDLMRRDGAKIVAAISGRSWTVEPAMGRPVTIRFAKRDYVAEPISYPELRAAA